MSLDKNVHVYRDDGIVLVMWDGKEYELSKEPVEVKRGVAEHWQGLHDIRIEEVPEGVIEQRTPVNPLEQNNRGKAFARLMKGKEDDETAAIRAKGKELGIKSAHNMGIDKLKVAIAEAEKLAEQKQEQGDT